MEMLFALDPTSYLLVTLLRSSMYMGLKAPSYHDARVYGTPGTAMPNSRDWEEHKLRRHMWDHGFSQKQLIAYEPRVIKLADILCSRLSEFDGRGPRISTVKSFNESAGQVIDLGAWLDYFMFDVMGDLGFSKAFGLLYDGVFVETLSLRSEEKRLMQT
jgi:cytochrome P450 family 628